MRQPCCPTPPFGQAAGQQEHTAVTPRPECLPLRRAAAPATAVRHPQPGPALWVGSAQKPRWVGEPGRWVCRRPRFKSSGKAALAGSYGPHMSVLGGTNYICKKKSVACNALYRQRNAFTAFSGLSSQSNRAAILICSRYCYCSTTRCPCTPTARLTVHTAQAEAVHKSL